MKQINAIEVSYDMSKLRSYMTDLTPGTDEYGRLMKQYLELSELLKYFLDKEVEEKKLELEQKKLDIEAEKARKQNWINPNDIIGAAVNLAGIGLILKHEELAVISTKALGFVKKLRF